MLSNPINVKLNDIFPNCLYNFTKFTSFHKLQNGEREALVFPLVLPKDSIIILRKLDNANK